MRILWRAMILVAGVAVPLCAQERVHRGIPASPSVSMRVWVPSGTVRIAVWNRDSIDVSGTMSASASLFGGGNREYAKFGIEPLRTGDTRLPEADLVVTVPRAAHVWVKMTAGTIETDGTAGEIELYTVGGRIIVQRATGVTSVESIDASVTISASRGDIRVRGGKGALQLVDVAGTASVTSVSGRVEIRGASAPEGRIEALGGDIAVDVLQLKGVVLDLQTHSGAISAVVRRPAVPLLDLVSRSGRVTNAAPTGQRVNGSITARSFRGPITIELRTK
ncbi:MAG: DUF4097 family beta strand repeat protein [Gemmatimonadaceae bacterium]|nr:DUF4097 family beta strand repeat protein [Gemmatimonadaceae bacterium]